MEIRADYGTGRIGTDPSVGKAFLDEMDAWMHEIGASLVKRGVAKSYETVIRNATKGAPTAGQVTLYLIGNDGVSGVNLVASQATPRSNIVVGRPDGVSIYARVRELEDGRWKTEVEGHKRKVPLPSLETIAVISSLSDLLTRQRD